jgi:hypothetical protein
MKGADSMNQFISIPSFNNLMDVTVPKGALFYPCCGQDTYYPLALFKNIIEDFHFADPFQLSLPNLKNLEHFQARPPLVKTLEQFDESFKIVNQQQMPRFYYEGWESSQSRKKFNIYSHPYDGEQVIEKLNSISVFFYRGDSMCDGGSGIKWFGPELFNKVLDKLVDGGLIITDGSNPDPKHLMTKWKSLYEHSHWGFPDLEEGEMPENFTYDWKRFICLGKIGERYGNVYVWQVKSIERI